ncbi:hypothetical protein L7F22_061154 [Adiantum nelumboides]|nr:hypothetical protein [Adiantum nelumboides]
MAHVQYVSFFPSNKTNVMGTLNMLGLAKRIRAPFLLTSTSEAYGDPLEHPQSELYWGHVNPISRTIKLPCLYLESTSWLDSDGSYSPYIHIFNTYGPRMCIDNRRVVSTFVAQAVKEVIDPQARIQFKKNIEDDLHERKPDITKTKNILH